ncbi:MAG: hypothetical protein RLZZ367_1693 [Bacteroidota bacterium]|jgi:ADP-L-glycero-D-manno-heptose 6-epimerase
MSAIVVTGAAGFIASNLVRKLNAEGHTNLILVDYFDNPAKAANLAGLQYNSLVNRDNFIEWLTENSEDVGFVYHLGARTDTTEFNFRVLDSLNLSYSKAVWEVCAVKQIPLVYASSAATYGMGEKTFSDDHSLLRELKPLNPYGLSKHLFDLYVMEQVAAGVAPPFWCGLKFFNVYGPHEFHKGRMASVVWHAYNQIKQAGKVKLFGSHNPAYKDGEQLRDFIFVDDVTAVCYNFYKAQANATPAPSAIYNLGTGHARTFNDLVKAIFAALQLPVQIDYIPTPADIRDKYQYFTEAKMDKLKTAGLAPEFTLLEDGVKKYVDYLQLL